MRLTVRSVGLFQVVERTEICSCICKNVQGRRKTDAISEPGPKGSEAFLKTTTQNSRHIRCLGHLWLPYSRPAALPTPVFCHDSDPITAHGTSLVLSTPNKPLLFSLPCHGIFCLSDSYILSLLPTACLFMSDSHTLRVVICYLESLSHVKYSDWME